MKLIAALFLFALTAFAGFSAETIGNAQGASFLFPVDFNEDGREDLLCTAWDDSAIVLFENLETGWSESEIVSGFPGATCVWAGDINGDDLIDMAGTAWEEEVLRVWYGNAGGGWTVQTVAEGLPAAHEVTGCDINGNGHVDLLVAVAGTGTVSIWYNDGSSSPSWTEQVLSSELAGARSVCTGDFDDDGNMDIAAAALTEDCVRWWSNSGGTEPSWTEHSLTESFNGAHMVRCGDLDSDGIPDLAAVAYYSNQVRVWASSEGFEEHTVASGFPRALGICLADYDNDGQIDIAGTSETQGDLKWWRNTGLTETWPGWTVDSSLPGAWPVCAADFDDNGWADLSAGGSFSGAVRVYLNDTEMGVHHQHPEMFLITGTNPSRGALTLSFSSPGSSSASLSLRDLTGRTVFQEEFAPGETHFFSLSTVSLPPGIYALELSGERGSLTETLTVL